MLSIVTALALVTLEILRGQFHHGLIPVLMGNDRRVPFDWWILLFCHVQWYQPWRYWNNQFHMLVDYWYNILLVGSWMGKSLHIFYPYLVFRAKFWLFLWKFRMHARCRRKGEEVYFHLLFNCFLLWSRFRHWVVEGVGNWCGWIPACIHVI